MALVAVTLDVDKEILELAFPLNIRAKMLSEAIVEKLRLPTKEGMAYGFLIKNQGTDQPIEPNKTFAETGVFHGSRLILRPRKVVQENKNVPKYKAYIKYDNGRIVPLKEQTVIFGRNDLSRGVLVDIDVTDLSPKGKNISRQHAKIDWRNGKYFIIDLKSTNGTRLNGNVVGSDKPAQLSNNDKIELGNGFIYFTFVEEN
jgi:hypothetical protein